MTQKTIRNCLIGLTLAVLLGLWGGMIYQCMAYNEVGGQLDVEINRLSAMQKEIASIKSSIDGFKTEKEEFSKLLFNERDVPAFLDQISDHAKQASISIADMKTQQFNPVGIQKDIAEAASSSRKLDKQVQMQKKSDELRRAATLSAMPISIRVKGTYASFVKFLDYLQEYKQLVNITNVEIRVAEYPLLDCEFVIRIYALKNIAELQRL